MKLYVFGTLFLAAGALSAAVAGTELEASEAGSKRSNCGGMCGYDATGHDPSLDNDSPGCSKNEPKHCWASCTPGDDSGRSQDGKPNGDRWQSGMPWCWLTSKEDPNQDESRCISRSECTRAFESLKCISGPGEHAGCWGTP